MNLGTLDLSMWPPALVFALVCIVLVCHVLPDVITLAPKTSTSLPPSTGGTSSPVPSRTTTTSV